MENSRYLIFTSAGRNFSLPFGDIKIIIAAQTPTPVPDFPDYVPGTVVNEGEVVQVIELRRRYHYDPKAIYDKACIIISMVEEVSVGLLLS
ncbi:chemotaxis protein CheW, partial [Ruminococcus sp.]|uniref:chemotaxis protein CheW n=1 Tax=Ruminococcus sp. TaxID=41978 RepID=UPI003FEFCD0A